MSGRWLLFPGVFLLFLGLALMGASTVHTMSDRFNAAGAREFQVTAYFNTSETVYVSILPNQKWGGVITMDVEVALNVSFVGPGGGETNLTAYYLASPASTGLTAPSMELDNVSSVVSSGDAPLSDVGEVAPGIFGGNIRRDGNLTVAVDKQSVYNNFMSTTPPEIILRKAENYFPYSYLQPFGIVSLVSGVPFLLLGWRKSEGRRRKR
jgi:hypothetical protein